MIVVRHVPGQDDINDPEKKEELMDQKENMSHDKRNVGQQCEIRRANRKKLMMVSCDVFAFFLSVFC